MNETETKPAQPLAEPTLTEVYGRPAVVIPARRQSHVRKSGEVVYRDVVETYLVERPSGAYVDLVKPGGEVYTVTASTCTCPAFMFGGGEPCKHVAALVKLGMFAPPKSAPSPRILDDLDRPLEHCRRGA